MSLHLMPDGKRLSFVVLRIGHRVHEVNPQSPLDFLASSSATSRILVAVVIANSFLRVNVIRVSRDGPLLARHTNERTELRR